MYKSLKKDFQISTQTRESPFWLTMLSISMQDMETFTYITVDSGRRRPQ